MNSGRKIRHAYSRLRQLIALGVISASLLIVFLTADYFGNQAEQQLNQKAAETLAVQSETLSGVLEKYRLIPPLLTRQNDIADLFLDADPDVGRERAHIRAEEVAGLSGAREVAFYWPDGRLLASARDVYHDQVKDLGELIDAARQGRLGRMAVALSTPDRAYAFSAGVRRNGALIGIIVVYVGFEGIEAAWSLSTNPIFVSDETGTIVLTNRPAWRLKPARDIINADTIRNPYRNMQRDLPLLKWELHVISSLGPARAARLTAALVATIICVVSAVGIFLVLGRREQQELQLRRDRAQALRLERIIRDRTRALTVTNLTLSHEVEERRQAEEKLRRTQAELIQTAKLAVLGQMAATLGHEMNQPLAAMKTYAANAARFLELSRPSDVVGALQRISAMVDRMAELSGALLSFSRKPGTEMRPIPLSSALDEALILVRPRAAKSEVTIHEPDNADDLAIIGGRIRLSQVFVNLINNAIDALKGRSDGEIRLLARREAEEIVVTIADNGPGIAADVAERIFDPFFTTKPPGEGIGVGLSIVYNIVHEFGGSIRLVEGAQPGCIFELRLRAA